MTEFRIFPNADGTHSLLTGEIHGYSSPFRMSEEIRFHPSELLSYNGAFNYKGTLEISDLKTPDVFTFEIKKEAYRNPVVRFSKNHAALGDFEELLCGQND
jgi:hypothetical protein